MALNLVTVRQEALADFAFSASLPLPALPGSLILCFFSRQDNANEPNYDNGYTRVGATGLRAHTSFGGRGGLGWKRAAGGEQAGMTSSQQGGCYICEIRGTDPALTGPIAGTSTGIDDQFNNISFAAAAPARPALVVAGVVTRLQSGGTLTVTGPTGAIRVLAASALANSGSNGRGCIVLAESPAGSAVTFGVTQAGPTQDGYRWGIRAASFQLPSVKGFPGEPGGGVW